MPILEAQEDSKVELQQNESSVCTQPLLLICDKTYFYPTVAEALKKVVVVVVPTAVIYHLFFTPQITTS